MFKPTLTAVVMATLAAPAFAGSLAPAAPEPAVQVPAPVAVVPVAQPSADWTGFYLGAQVGSGNFEGTSDLGFEDDLTGTTYGLHGGYLQDFGRVVVGGELSYDDASEIGSDLYGIDGESLLSAKLRVGYDLGSFLPYLSLGGAQLTTTGAIDDSDTGYSYGIGADYALTDNWRVGAEISQFEFDDFADSGVDISGTNAALRVSFSF